MKSLLLNWVSRLHFNRKISLSPLFFVKKNGIEETFLINTIYYTNFFVTLSVIANKVFIM